MPQRLPHALRPSAERARTLATRLRTFQPDEQIPSDLKEATFLLQESQNRTRSAIERLRILGLMIASVDRFSIESFVNRQEPTQSGSPHPEGTWSVFAEKEPVRSSAQQDGYRDALHNEKNGAETDELLTYLSDLLEKANRSLQTDLLPDLLASYQVNLLPLEALSPEQFQWLRQFYNQRVYPLLTPLAVDPGRPFPFISSFSLNVLVLLKSDQKGTRWARPNFARVKIPRLLPRFVNIPVNPSSGSEKAGSENADSNPQIYVRSEEVVQQFLGDLFPGLEVDETYFFRVLRVGEGSVNFDDVLVTRGLRRKQLNLPVVRVDIEPSMPKHLVVWLAEHLRVSTDVCFRLDEMMGQLHLVELANLLEGDPSTTTTRSIFRSD